MWPDEYPLVFRLSLTDWRPDGWQVEDSIHLSRRLKELGVDAIACSTGGISGRERPQGMALGHGYQLPLAGQLRRAAGIATVGVGLLWDPRVVEQSIEQGDIDLVALARELLDDPNSDPARRTRARGRQRPPDVAPRVGWWLEKRARALRRLHLR